MASSSTTVSVTVEWADEESLKKFKEGREDVYGESLARNPWNDNVQFVADSCQVRHALEDQAVRAIQDHLEELTGGIVTTEWDEGEGAVVVRAGE